MTVTDHISDQIFDRYARRESDAGEVSRLQAHLASCEKCRQKLAQVTNAETAFAAVHHNFAFDEWLEEPEHLAYEQLEFFVDGKLDAVDCEIAESHLAFCTECTKDLADLRIYREIAAQSATNAVEKTSEAGAAKPTFWQKVFAFGSAGSFIPVAAVLLIAILVGAWFLFLRGNSGAGEMALINNQSNSPANNFAANIAVTNNTAPEVTPLLTPSPVENPPTDETLYAINDGQLKIDVRGNLKGSDNFSSATQNLIKQSVQSGKITVPSNLLDGSGSSVLMSENNAQNGVPFALNSPIGKIIRESQPLLKWRILKDATNYQVAIVDDKFRLIEQSGKLTATNWKPSKPLPRGANYSWQVTATLADGSETVSPSSPAPQARFRVIEQNLFEDINRLEKSGNSSHLALGVLYAKAGLKQEARAEFEKLVKENPNSPLAKRLLQSIK